MHIQIIFLQRLSWETAVSFTKLLRVRWQHGKEEIRRKILTLYYTFIDNVRKTPLQMRCIAHNNVHEVIQDPLQNQQKTVLSF